MSSRAGMILGLWVGLTVLTAGCESSTSGFEVRAPAQPLVTSTIGMRLVHIDAGEFVMGSPKEERRRELDEIQHPVRLTKDFYMGRTEVTRGQFEWFVRETQYKTEAERAGDFRTWQNPGIVQTATHPVVCVTIADARAFCEWLSRVEKKRYRLPTEAEWEYACRGGTAAPFYLGGTISTEQANFNGTTTYGGGPKGESRSGTLEVAKFPANPWGLHDMIGNVWEWCSDRYSRYPETLATDPAGAASGEVYLTRGGSWANAPEYCRSAYRFGARQDQRFAALGFRVVLER